MHVQTSFLKHALKAGILAIGLTVATGVAHATSMTFSGTTSGSFTGTGTQTDGILAFANGSFNGATSSNGTGGFGQAGTMNGSFGTFTLGSSPTQTFNGDPFNLNILFTNPTGISGGQNSSFTATAVGQVTSTTGGAVRITFSPTTQTYTFGNASSTGSFTLSLDTLTLGAGQSTSVSGFITSNSTNVAATPEPMSLALLGTGLVGVAGLAYRKRKVTDMSLGAMAA